MGPLETILRIASDCKLVLNLEVQKLPILAQNDLNVSRFGLSQQGSKSSMGRERFELSTTAVSERYPNQLDDRPLNTHKIPSLLYLLI